MANIEKKKHVKKLYGTGDSFISDGPDKKELRI